MTIINRSRTNGASKVRDQPADVIAGLDAVPVAYTRQDLEPLVLAGDVVEDVPAAVERRRLVLVAGDEQEGRLDGGVVGDARRHDDLAERGVAHRVLGQDQLADEGLLQRRAAGSRRLVGDRVGHGLHSGCCIHHTLA